MEIWINKKTEERVKVLNAGTLLQKAAGKLKKSKAIIYVQNHEVLIADKKMFLDDFQKADSEPTGLTPLEKAERVVISDYLRINQGNKSKTKDDLGITINTLNSKIKKYEIPVKRVVYAN